MTYHFSHRTFQEYFAAWYTCKLTDEIQSKLLSNWLKESDAAVNDSYFTMLYNMQSEKVNKIILFPIIGILNKRYNELGFSIHLLSEMFQGVSLRVYYRNIAGEKLRHRGLSLSIKDRQKCSAIRLTCILNGYSFPVLNNKVEEKVFVALEKIAEKFNGFIPFNNVLDIVDEKVLLEALAWFEKQVLFSISCLDKYKKNDISKKKKVSSILNEL